MATGIERQTKSAAGCGFQSYAYCVRPVWTEDDLRLRLHPFTTTANLVRASLVITSFELLRVPIVDNIRDFLAEKWGPNGGSVESPSYEAAVLGDGADRLEGSLAWLERNGVLSTAQVAAVRRLRAERNRLAHELGGVLVDPSQEVDTSLIGEAVGVAVSLGQFWGSVTVDTDPQFDGRDVNYDEIRSGVALLLEHLQNAAAFAEALAQLAAKDLAGELDSDGDG